MARRSVSPTGPAATAPVEDPLARFTAPVAAWFQDAFAAPTTAQVEGWAAIARGGHVLLHAPTGSGKTLAAFLWGIDRLVRSPAPPRTAAAGASVRILYVSPLKALTYDVERNLRAPLAGIALAGRRLGSPVRAVSIASRTGRHALGRAAGAGEEPARDPHHHAGVALPPADVGGPRDPARGGGGDRRRGARGRGNEARRPPGALPGAARAPARSGGAAAPADRPLGHPEAARHDRAVPRRRRARPGRHRRRCRDPEAAGPPRRGADRGHEPARRGAAARGAAGRPRRRRRDAGEHLAGHPPADPGAHPEPPEHARLRQQPAACGAPRPASQRAGRRGPGASPPRVDRPRAAGRDRGGAQGRPPSGAGRDELARARDRHGRDRPRHPGRVADLGRPRPPADRPRRAPGRRGECRRHLPEVPGRPPRMRGRGGADARRGDRGDDGPAHAPRRAGPADRRDDGDGSLVRGGPARRGGPGHAVRDDHARGPRGRPGHACRRLSVRRVRRAQAPPHLGPADRHGGGPPRRAGRRGHLGGHHSRSRPVRRLRGRRGRDAGPAGGRAGRGDGLRAAGRDARRRDRPRGKQLASRRDHSGPRDRGARPGPAGQAPVLEGRRCRPPDRAGPRAGCVRARGRGRSRPRGEGAGGRVGAPAGTPSPRPAGGREPRRLPRGRA